MPAPRTPESTGAASREESEGGTGLAEPARSASRRERAPSRDEAARVALSPLAEGERPPALRVAVAVAALLAVAVAVSVLTVHDLRRHGGSAPAGAFIAAVLAALAWGMYDRRYWAVLGFEGLLTFQVLASSLALVVASTVPAAAACVLSIGLGGWLFWKLVRVMGRIQAGERLGDGLR